MRRSRRLRPPQISSWSRDHSVDTRSGRPPAAGDLLIASYNIHKAVGRDRRFDPERIVGVIEQIGADVIALQEADQRFGDKAGLLDLALLQRRTGLQPVPVQSPWQGHGWHGNVVLFRNGIVTASRQLVLPGVEPRGALIVDLTIGNTSIRIVAAHLGLLRRSRSRQVEVLINASKPTDGRPIFLMGDLNEWRLGKKSSLHGLAPKFGPLQAAIPSFPARFPLWALDRIVAYPADSIARVELHDTPLSRIASDHLPIKAVINLPGGARHAH
ncbi:diguanylate cyclase [Bosea sp. PAMC 26642]|nr:diguanylate cyclase [Bosea sp. PAMC 26642]